MADDSARIIEARFTEKKTRRGFKYYFKWAIFFVILIGILSLYGYYKLNKNLDFVKSKTTVASNAKTEINKPVQSLPVTENKPAVQEIKSGSVENSDIQNVQKRLDHLEERDDNLVVYLAVGDLKNSLNNPDNFKSALETLQSLTVNIPELNGHLDILFEASENGLVTNEKLLADLAKIKEQLKSSHDDFGDNVKNIFSDLIKVTKVSGEVDKADYNSIIKRTEITLSKGNLTIKELDEMIKEMQNIGKSAEDFVREANNLKRVLEVIDSLSINIKQRLAK